MRVRPSIRLMLAGLTVCALLFAPKAGHSQTAAAAATAPLLEKAHALEVRGRMDMAAQTWQQVLLADPNNTQALGGLARAAKLGGHPDQAASYLARLRAISPNDPEIQRVEGMMTQQNQSTELQQAGKYAEAGQYSQAMTIYRQVFGNNPPPGDWALAYYETESATEDGRPHAIAGLRALVEKYPSDSRYQIALGRILTYNPKTRTEGRKLLQRHPYDPQATEALRQSLLWDSANPASGADIRSYLAKHKDDQQLTTALKSQPRVAGGARRASGPPPAPLSPEQQAELSATRTRNAEEQAAYNSLNAKRLQEAEDRFKAILASDPSNARALAGMGYIRMQQQNFGGAISYLEQAKQDGAKDPGLDNNLATSRFWYTMGEGQLALNENDLTTAEKQYRLALSMRPTQPEALEGLGGTLLKAQQSEAAIPVFERFIKVKPSADAAWRGLFTAQYQAGQASAALATERRIPPTIRARLMHDPDFLRNLASAYSAVGRDADAQRVLRGALELPFPADGKGLKTETQLQYASLLQQSNRLDQSAGLYRQVLSAEPTNTSAWEGLIRVEHANKNDALALQTLESMPPSSYDAALRDPGFISTVASIYQEQNKLDVAQGMLEKAVAQQNTAGQKPPAPLLIQLAGVYMLRNDPQHAYPLYRQVLLENPDRLDGWKGLLNALHSTGHDQEALAQLRQIPQPVRVQLENDPDYLQTVAGVYNGLNQPQEALVFLNRVQQKYAAANSAPPADIDIQNAWLLFNSGNDTSLYRQLMMLGGRTDLTDDQRRTVQTIWANWAVRRANQAAAAGNVKRSLAILNAAAKAFPDNPGVIRALAGGYARAGLPKQAVAIFKAQDMTAASASDYKSAVGAALAAGDTKDAEVWLRYGLDAYPQDAQMLLLGAKFEKARGDDNRAAEYYRASLAAMPPPDPGAELANELSRPVPAAAVRLPSQTQSQDLATLLSPNTTDGFVTTAPGQPAPAPRPYLPNYGNEFGQAPVTVTGSGTYSGTFNVVPSYMTNPEVQGTTTKSRKQPTRNSTLGNYVPQAAAETPPPPGGYEMPAVDTQTASTLPQTQPTNLSPAASQGDSSFQDYQNQQIRRMTQQAQASQPMMQLPPQQAEVYGPYVPYVPGNASGTTTNAGYVYSPQQVSLADNSPRIDPKQREITDVLPTARYVPNSASNRTGSSHPDIAALEATNARRHQSDPPRTMQGQSNPPPDNYDIAPVEQTQYNSQQQLPQPQQRPSQQTQQQQQNYPPQNYPQQQQTYPPLQQQNTGTYGQQYPQPNRPRAGTATRRRRPRQAVYPVGNGPAQAPLFYPGVPTLLNNSGYPVLGPAYPVGTPPCDQQLINKNVPALRGNYDPNCVPAKAVLTEREQAELDLAQLEASYSAWLGGSGIVRYRSGTPGFDRLIDLEAPFEATAVLGKTVRLSVIPKAVFLNSGAIDNTTFQNQTGNIPVLGTLPANVLVAPAQQFASGVGGEVQLNTTNLGIAVGYTPWQFLVANITARLRVRPFGKNFTLFGERDSVKDTQLSYAGLRDPGQATLTHSGPIWGGVISTGGGARLDFGSERAGFYVSGDGASITGYHVLPNRKYEGTMGAYFRVREWPEAGSLNVGASFFGMHYDQNERGMTYGLGGYFSPEAYFLASVPVTFNGHYKTDWHYVINGSVGVQTFQEDNQVFFPLDRGIQTGFCTGNAVCTYPVNSNTGLNYAVNAEGAYRVADHWYVGGFFSGNNTNNYNTASGGFFVRYLFKTQYPTEDYPTGLFPIEGFRPLRVP